MPRLNDDLEQHQLPSGHFGFSAVSIDKLGATQYTLVSLVFDRSGSVAGFEQALENCLVSAVESCQFSPHAENVLLRVVTFSNDLLEVHGFVPLAQIDKAIYTGTIQSHGATSLHAAFINAIDATKAMAKQLLQNDYEVNGLIIAATDGMNTQSPREPEAVKMALDSASQTESMGKLTTILVGLNEDAVVEGIRVGDVLQRLVEKGGIGKYIGIDDANPRTLAKLGEFISKSISSASRQIATGTVEPEPELEV